MGPNKEEDQIENLGEMLASARLGESRLSAPSTLLVSGIFLILILATAGYGFQRGYYGFTQFGLVAAAAWGAPWLAAGAALTLPLAAWVIYRARDRGRVLSIHRQGLHVILDRRKEYAILWPGIAGIQYEGVQTVLFFLPQPALHKLAVIPVRGPSLTFVDRFGRLDLLVEEIKKRYYPIKLPEYRQALNSGRALAFGPVLLESGGVRLGDDRIRWSEIEAIQIQRGELIFKFRSQKPSRLHVFDIPDLELLLTLIEEKTAS